MNLCSDPACHKGINHKRLALLTEEERKDEHANSEFSELTWSTKYEEWWTSQKCETPDHEDKFVDVDEFIAWWSEHGAGRVTKITQSAVTYSDTCANLSALEEQLAKTWKQDSQKRWVPIVPESLTTQGQI